MLRLLKEVTTIIFSTVSMFIWLMKEKKVVISYGTRNVLRFFSYVSKILVAGLIQTVKGKSNSSF